MSDKSVPPWFARQEPPSSDDPELARRRAQLRQELPKLLAARRQRGRAQNFYPYLLVRSVLGDRGDRPINTPFWESPDIWTAPGDPGVSPDVPPTHGGTVIVGQPNTVYTHVWNLGFAPLVGVHVEFYWFDPSLGIDGAHAHLIGVARCELAGRGMAGSHQLVKCPKPWLPVPRNGGHECLVVRVFGVGDPIGANEWSSWQNRHVAQRNVTVVDPGARVDAFVESLNATRHVDAHVQLIQVGAAEGALAARLVAPTLKVSAIDTHLLGELTAANDVVLPRVALQLVTPLASQPARLNLPAGVLAPVHALAFGGPPTPPVLKAPSATAVLNPAVLLKVLRTASPTVPTTPPSVATTAHLADLLAAVGQLQQGAPQAGPPAPGEAHVLRMASYVGDQLVGGYTVVVGGAR